METKYKVCFDVVTPDGVTIDTDKNYNTVIEAIYAASDWVKGYKTQKYFITSTGEKILVKKLLYRLDLIGVSEHIQSLSTKSLEYQTWIKNIHVADGGYPLRGIMAMYKITIADLNI